MAGEREESSLREEELEKEIESLRLAYLEKAGDLSRKRHEAALRLSWKFRTVWPSSICHKRASARTFPNKKILPYFLPPVSTG